ncbi:transposase [Fodinicola feengrottensis]|uniref:transposase n=1 Tax=Fodinicola feengrottensis TaxID=435914 RepID=UPI0031E0B774
MSVIRERQAIAAELKERLANQRVATLTATVPGIGMLGAARLLPIIGDASAFTSADHLAAFAGVTPGEEESPTRAAQGLMRCGRPR